MFFIGKKIVYLNAYDDERKVSSAGFVRILGGKEDCKLEVCVQKLQHWKDGSCQVILEGSDKEIVLGKVIIKRGEGCASFAIPVRGEYLCFGGREEAADCFFGIVIVGEGGQTVCGRWKEAEYGGSTFQAEKEAEYGRSTFGEEKKFEHRRGTSGEEKKSEHRRGTSETEKKPDAGIKEVMPEESETVFKKADRSTSVIQPKQEQVERQEWVEGYAEDKWQQLCKIYPKVHPFGDKREFITIEPKDFIILQSSYQKLVNNSFLLHGFYNYRHIILGICSELSNEEGYYLGVPGSFYEREKMVAVMFGFEGFECSGPVEVGKFGYYMRRVEL